MTPAGTTAGVAFLDGGSAPSVGNGTVFRLTPAGALTTLYAFPGRPDGVEPLSALVQADDGRFYGTCMGGAYSFGMVFQLTVPMAPRITSARKLPGAFTFDWTAVSGQTYQPQFKTNLSDAAWQDLGTNITATNGRMSTIDTTLPSPGKCYRIVLQQP